MKFASWIAALLLLATGCGKSNSAGLATARLHDAVAKNEVIDLKKFTPFEWDREVVRSFEVGRREADFASLHRTNGYSPQEAVFIVRETEDGWKKLQER